jgi:hypothetical protein
MVDVLTEIQIKCRKEKVADYASNPDNATEWYENIKSIEWKTSKPLALGSRIAFVANFMGKKLSYTYEIVELISGKKLRMKTVEGLFPMETTYTWEIVDDKTTLMTLRNSGNPKGFSSLVAPLIAVMMKKANKKDLNKIKEILEK